MATGVTDFCESAATGDNGAGGLIDGTEESGEGAGFDTGAGTDALATCGTAGLAETAATDGNGAGGLIDGTEDTGEGVGFDTGALGVCVTPGLAETAATDGNGAGGLIDGTEESGEGAGFDTGKGVLGICGIACFGADGSGAGFGGRTGIPSGALTDLTEGICTLTDSFLAF